MAPAYCVELGQEMPNGEMGFITACYPETELFETTFVRGEMAAVSGVPFYARAGDWVGTSAVGFGVLLVGFALWRRS